MGTRGSTAALLGKKLGESSLFLGLTAWCPLQFVCVESLVTAVVDMYPKVFRRGYRRELLILALSVVSYFLGLVMLTEVSTWGWAQGQGPGNPSCWCEYSPSLGTGGGRDTQDDLQHIGGHFSHPS